MLKKFEDFLKQILTVIFMEIPFDKQKAEKNLKKIKQTQNLTVKDVKYEHNR